MCNIRWSALVCYLTLSLLLAFCDRLRLWGAWRSKFLHGLKEHVTKKDLMLLRGMYHTSWYGDVHRLSNHTDSVLCHKLRNTNWKCPFVLLQKHRRHRSSETLACCSQFRSCKSWNCGCHLSENIMKGAMHSFC